MPIQVTCTNCRVRFQVSEKFAGKKGPCPKCKTIIRVPTLDEQVVIHAPEEFTGVAGPPGAAATLKPIARKKARLRPLLLVGVIGTAIVLFVGAWLLQGSAEAASPWLLGAGAFALGPPLAWAGYTFLRNDELEPYRGRELLVRTLICGAAYAIYWGAYTYLYGLFYGSAAIETWNVLPFAAAFLSLGAGTAYVCYDLDFGSGFFHYALYLLATVLLRLTLGLSPV
jgi:hypothetical protein